MGLLLALPELIGPGITLDIVGAGGGRRPILPLPINSRGSVSGSDHGLKITTHISAGTFSLEKGFLKYLRETGRTDVRYLMQLGILDPNGC